MHDLSYTQIQFQIPIPWLNIISISSKQMTYRKWPNPISNPIHGFDNIHDLRYKPIQFQIPIPSRTTLSISSNKTAHRKWPNPISNPIYGNPCFDIFKGRQDFRYTPIQFLTPILRLAFISISSFWKSGPNWYVFQYRVGLGRVLRKSQQEGSGRIEVLKYLIRYFRVPYFLSVFFGCVWCFQVFRILRVHAIFRVDPKC